MGPYVIAALCMMVLDIATGVVKALRDHSISSVKARDGLYNKMGYIIIMVVAALCEYATGTMDFGFELQIPLLGPTCIYIFLTELASIIENVTIINPKLLKFLSQYLATSDESDDAHAHAQE